MLEPAVASAASALPSASEPPVDSGLAALTGPAAEEGESRANECRVETLARDLWAPAWLLTGRDGTVYAVEADTIKRNDVDDHRARVYALSGSKARVVADVAARVSEVALVGTDVFLEDLDADELLRIPLSTGERMLAGARPHGIAAQGDVLVRATVSPERVQLAASGGTVATLAGKWSSDRVPMAFSPTHAYFYVFSHADDAGSTKSVLEGHLARAPLGGQAELLGTMRIAWSLATGGGFLFAGSYPSLLRLNEETGEWQRAPQGLVDNIAADAKAAVWTEANRGTIRYWPHVGMPFLVCAGLPGVVGIAMNESHIYFSAYGADLTAGGATIGRFARPR